MTGSVDETIRIRVVGGAEAEKAAASLNRLVEATDHVAVSNGRADRVRERSEASLNRIAARYDQNFRAMKQAEQAQKDLDRAREAGLAGTIAYERAITALSRAQNDNTRAVGLARHEWINLSRQLQDVGVSLAGGQSPFMVLTQQGGQIADVLSSSGAGAGAALRDFGRSVARFALNPITLIAGAAATAGVAFYRWKESTDALTISLNGLGRQSGLTVSGLASLSERASQGSRVSAATARGFAAQFAGAGVPGVAIEGAVGLTPDFSRRLGLDMADAAKELASALADPAKGAEELAKRYGIVSLAEREHIRELAAVGDKSQAAAELVAILGKRISEMDDPTWRLIKIWETAKAGFSNGLDKFAKIIDTAIEGPQEIARRQQEQARKALDSALRAQEDQDAARAKDLGRLREDASLAVREVEARTLAERTALEVERARIRVMRESGDAVKAAIAADAERAKMLAEAARKVGDLERSSQDNLELSRLSPFARRMREIDIAERNFRNENLPNAATPMAAEFNTAATAARNVADAFNGLATSAKGGFGRLIPLSDSGIQGTSSRGDPRGMAAFIQSEARRLGIDPAIALRVARSEGLRTFSGDQGTSGGAFQLHVGGRVRGGNAVAGMGDDFRRATGLDPLDPANERATITFALQTARRVGWGPFHGAARAGIGAFEGIGGRAANDNGDLSARTSRAFANQRSQAMFEMAQKPIEDTNKEIERQRLLLTAQTDAFGRSSAAVAQAARQQELLNSLQSQGVPISDQLRASIDAAAENYGRLVAEQERAAESQRRYIDSLDLLRESSRDVLGGLITGLKNGKSAGDALGESLSRIADRLISVGVDRIVESLFGRSGTANAGAGGGFLSSLFSGLFSAFESGGVVGAPGGRMVRAPLSAFAGAPHFASGGAVPVIAHAGEVILNAAQQANVAAALKAARGTANNNAAAQRATAAPVTVNLIGAPSGTSVSESRDSRGGRRIDVTIGEMVGAANNSPQGADALAAGFGVKRVVARR